MLAEYWRNASIPPVSCQLSNSGGKIFRASGLFSRHVFLAPVRHFCGVHALAAVRSRDVLGEALPLECRESSHFAPPRCTPRAIQIPAKNLANTIHDRGFLDTLSSVGWAPRVSFSRFNCKRAEMARSFLFPLDQQISMAVRVGRPAHSHRGTQRRANTPPSLPPFPLREPG